MHLLTRCHVVANPGTEPLFLPYILQSRMVNACTLCKSLYLDLLQCFQICIMLHSFLNGAILWGTLRILSRCPLGDSKDKGPKFHQYYPSHSSHWLKGPQFSVSSCSQGKIHSNSSHAQGSIAFAFLYRWWGLCMVTLESIELHLWTCGPVTIKNNLEAQWESIVYPVSTLGFYPDIGVMVYNTSLFCLRSGDPGTVLLRLEYPPQ